MCSSDLYSLLFNEDLPGWLYAVNMGATTIWERWNSVLEDGTINPQGMNSLNHYAYGSVVEWMYRDMCGINPVEDCPGFRKILFSPHPEKRLAFAHADFDSPMGRIESGWEYTDDGIRYRFVVPFGASAEIILPGEEMENEGEKIQEWTVQKTEKGLKLILTVGPGSYAFLVKPFRRPTEISQ